MKQYKWGIIGPGKIAKKFGAALALTEGPTLEAVASRDIDRARDFAATFGAARSYDSYEALAADPAIDVIYIATPHGYHHEHALLCLRQGKAVLCEKPMALYGRQVHEMIETSFRNKTFLMEAMWTRFLPMTDKILELIGDGQLGEIKYVRADFGFSAPFSPQGRLYDLRLGGGSLLDIGVYPLFLCLLLLGEPQKITAAGQLAASGADESCHALFHYDNGSHAIVSSTLACQTSITAEIAGTGGMIQIPAPWYKNHTFILKRKEEEDSTFTMDPVVNGFEYQIRETMRCLDAGVIESPKMTHAFSLMMSQTMDAIRGQLGVKYPGE